MEGNASCFARSCCVHNEDEHLLVVQQDLVTRDSTFHRDRQFIAVVYQVNEHVE
jgi:hypothetical protein